MFFLLKGLIIGLSVAAVVGPMAVLCMQRTLEKGPIHGLVSGLGIATADMLYSCIAAFGLTFIANFMLKQQWWVHLIGGVFLLYLGIRTLFTRPAEKAAIVKSGGMSVMYISTFLLTLTNPTTILSFIAIFAGAGLAQAQSNAGAIDYASAGLLVVGVFLGSVLWWLILITGVSILRARINQRILLWINRLSGVVLIVFAALALLSLQS